VVVAVRRAGELEPDPPSPFDDSRRLTGPNLYFADVAALLEVAGPYEFAALDAWQADVERAAGWLGWPVPRTTSVAHRGGRTLALTAPLDQLFVATDVNEWAWQRATGRSAGLFAPGYATPRDESAAKHCLEALARAERAPALMALIEAAAARSLPAYVDDDAVSVGDGAASRSWALDALPSVDAVPWASLRAMPKALVTGSNGKTTTVRLVAAACRRHGWRTGHSCTDGLFVDGARFEAGDYSGPAGARAVVRHPQVEAAVLETARGGLLRRGLAVRDADVAVVTNVSADHFGEYGIDSLDDVADAKLVVARGLRRGGTLVLNADDDVLVARAQALSLAVGGWFALDDAHPRLELARAGGAATCGVRGGELVLWRGGRGESLGSIEAMPLSVGGLARYNIANLAAAALVASAMGVPAGTLADLFARFGAGSADNPGRLQRWSLRGATVLLDYAHNPDGISQFLQVAAALRSGGRLGLLLGQAGNRPDDDIRELGRAAAAFSPDRVVLKDIAGYLRGRRPGEVPDLLEGALLACGLAPASIARELEEVAAARTLLAWARAGDVVALPVHAPAAREALVAMLDRMQDDGWRPGEALPASGTAAGA
jgi:UDP-N-acetylmuramyl tripeptide synthase